MDTIHILQKTYENLYVARIPFLTFLQERLPVISSQWKKDCVERVLYNDENLTFKQKERLKKHRKDITQLDIYYLLQIFLDEQNWNHLEALFPDDSYFFIQDNRELYYKVREIRCNVMHPSFEIYKYDDFVEWENTIISFVNLFSPDKDLQELRIDFHKEERDRLLKIIKRKVINPALKSSKLTDDFKIHIQNTKDRLEAQNTAEGIIAFFTDALDSIQGQEIGKTLEDNDLESFERIKNEVLKDYYR